MRAQLKWVVGLNTFEICLMNADGTNLVQPTDNALCEATGTWSADGQKANSRARREQIPLTLCGRCRHHPRHQ